MTEDGPGFFQAEDIRQAGWPFGAPHALDDRKFEVQHPVIEEQKRADGNFLVEATLPTTARWDSDARISGAPTTVPVQFQTVVQAACR